MTLALRSYLNFLCLSQYIALLIFLQDQIQNGNQKGREILEYTFDLGRLESSRYIVGCQGEACEGQVTALPPHVNFHMLPSVSLHQQSNIGIN